MSDYFDNYFFTSNLTDHVCPGFGSFQCAPPSACASDPNTGKTYCCDYVGDECWTTASSCGNDGSTVNCGSGQIAWCCLSKTEICTGAPQQINICWNSADDILGNISTSVLNMTYSSLSASNPASSSWSFDPATLIAATQTFSKTSSASFSSSSPTLRVSSAASTTPPPSSSPSSSASISGGAIGGIVIGVIAVITILTLGIYLLKRRNKQKMVTTPREYVYDHYDADRKAGAALHSQTRPQELDTGYAVPELDAGPAVSELEAVR